MSEKILEINELIDNINIMSGYEVITTLQHITMTIDDNSQ